MSFFAKVKVLLRTLWNLPTGIFKDEYLKQKSRYVMERDFKIIPNRFPKPITLGDVLAENEEVIKRLERR